MARLSVLAGLALWENKKLSNIQTATNNENQPSSSDLCLPASAFCFVLSALRFAFTTGARAQTVYQWNGTSSTNWLTPGNWAAPGIAPTNGTSNSRLNVYNGTGSACYYNFPGLTATYASTGRGLAIGNGTSSSMHISGGTFSTLGSTSADVIGNNANGTNIIDGGIFLGTAAGTSMRIGYGSPATTTILTITNGSATLANLNYNAAIATVNLDGGHYRSATLPDTLTVVQALQPSTSMGARSARADPPPRS